MQIGTIISTMDSPTTLNFDFVITNNQVLKGQFVEVRDKESNKIIASVVEINRSNRYFERAESVSEYQKNIEISDVFPSKEWEYTVARCKILGIFDKHIKRCKFPPAPGTKVYLADEEMLKKFLGFDENGLEIGKLQNHNIDVKLNLSRLLQKHLAILAMSGAGKSHLIGVLLEELMDRPKELGRIAGIVIDVHGEYSYLKSSQYSDRLEVFDCRKFRIPLTSVSASTFGEWVPGISGPQKRDLANILGELKKQAMDKQVPISLDDLIETILQKTKMAKNNKSLLTLLSWLDQIKKMNIISDTENPKIKNASQPGKVFIFDLSKIDNHTKKQIIVSHILKRIFYLRKKASIPPTVVVVEEAHNFCKEKVKHEHSLSKSIIETIAREGRKFGLSLCLISQRPIQLSTTALSQCNTNIIMRITNPYDLKHIGESCEGVDSYVLNTLTTLRVGEGIIIGEAVNYPTFVNVRNKKSRAKSDSPSLEKLSIQFENQMTIREEDVEAFL